jgi:hypothetical protein
MTIPRTWRLGRPLLVRILTGLVQLGGSVGGSETELLRLIASAVVTQMHRNIAGAAKAVLENLLKRTR